MTPLAQGEAARAPTWRAAWSDRTAALMAGLCEAAYEATAAAWIAPAGFRVDAVFGRGAAFLAVSADMAVLVFRGTSDLADWGIDLDARPVEMPDAPGVHVHHGFLNAWLAIRYDVTRAVDKLPRDLGIYVTGHSLGGALAQVATASLDRDTLAACYSFGAPRVATLSFDRMVKAPHYRVVDGWDLVPGVPTPWLTGFRHTGDPRLLTGDGLRAYRRDRSLATRAAVDLLGLVVLGLGRPLPAISDHAISRYRSRLQSVAASGGSVVTGSKGD